MKKIPVPVIIVSVLFIVIGCVGFVYHLKDFANADSGLYEWLWILFLRILAVVCGALLLYKINWARWLAIAWLAYHVVISAFNSTAEMVTHIVFLVVVSVLLFLPVSSKYFHNTGK